MSDLLGLLGSALDLLLVIVGFGLIIFVHELGHFLAAKWAGIRVLAFAIGFGPAAGSYRKGLGLRRGSSEAEYNALPAAARATISPTEYRINWLPFGGYVKMLGQDDVDPTAVSDAPDSYQNTPVWKRMIVISAGVVFNVIAAAVLFIAVFMHGLKTEPPVIGLVQPGSPASRATALLPEVGPGLRPGDRVLTVNDRRAQSFNDLVMASAMSRRNGSMTMVVDRPGAPEPITFRIVPEKSPQSGLLEIGVTPPWTGTILNPRSEREREVVRKMLARDGLEGVEPGMTLVKAGGEPLANGLADLIAVTRRSEGRPLVLEFHAADGRTVNTTMSPKAELQDAKVRMPSGSLTPVRHLLGLLPVLKVGNSPTGENEPQQGLREGDVFARVGALEYPSVPAGIAEIHRQRGKTIDVTVLRKQEDGGVRRVRIEPPPTVRKIGEGQIGFIADDADDTNLIALPPPALIDDAGQERRPAAAAVIDRSGLRVMAVDGRPTANFTEIRAALRESTADELGSGASARVSLTLALPIGEGADQPTEQKTWTIEPDDVRALHQLAWEPGISLAVEAEEFTLAAQGSGVLARAGDAIRMGLSETHRVMMMTYLTFARLFEGTVKVEHLKGPVGIAHMGTRIASRGLVWLLFFMALISVNLAVVNFLPLPIVDGGQFLFLVLERIRGRPLSLQVQNIATIAGLILIGTMFIIVTFNDIAGLFS